MYKGDTLIGRSIRTFINLCYARSNATNLLHKYQLSIKYQYYLKYQYQLKNSRKYLLMWMRISIATRDRAKLRKQF